MRKLKILVRGGQSPTVSLLRCPVTVIRLDSGETLKRGCGRMGLVPFEAGHRCFYCGNYRYADRPPLRDLWFHFRLAREYWRVQSASGREFVNGVPVSGLGDSLPAECYRDLNEPEPPPWFGDFVTGNDESYRQSIQKRKVH